MPRRRAIRPVATLWDLAWGSDRICCAVYRGPDGLELRLEKGSTTILSEPFELRPRALARVAALKQSLQRRGWRLPPSG